MEASKSMMTFEEAQRRRMDLREFVRLADVDSLHIGGDSAAIAGHIDGYAAWNLTSDLDLGRVLLFVGDKEKPEDILIFRADVAEFVRRLRKHERQRD